MPKSIMECTLSELTSRRELTLFYNVLNNLGTFESNLCKVVGSHTKDYQGVYTLKAYFIERVHSNFTMYLGTFESNMYEIVGSFSSYLSFKRGKTASWK